MNFVMLNMFFFGFNVFLIGILILLKRGDAVARRWFYFSLAVTGYAVGYGLVFSKDTPDAQALLIARIANASAALIPVTWLYFVCGFLRLKRHKLFQILWPVSIFLFMAGLTKWAIPSLGWIEGFGRHPEAGPTLHLQTINYFCVTSYGFYLMFRSLFIEESKERRREIVSFILATIFGFIGGAGEFSLIYFRKQGFDLSFLLVTYPFAMAYVMIKQHVLEAEKIADIFQREKLATIGLLAASVNHEIRNPLYAVKGLLETYVENVKEGLPHKEPLETSERALTQVNRALEVIGKLNRFAKPAGDNIPQGREASVSEAVQTVLDLVAYEFELDKIHIRNQANQDIPKIQADQRQLEEIFFNLIVNACHAMPTGGTLTVSSKLKLGKIILVISDTGSGISSDQLEHIFEPFHTTKGEKGTGLGLYITKQLIKRNGGRISVQSKPGQGTSFMLEFKRA